MEVRDPPPQSVSSSPGPLILFFYVHAHLPPLPSPPCLHIPNLFVVTSLFSSFIILSLYEWYLTGIIKYVIFCNWLFFFFFSLGIILQRFIQAVVSISTLTLLIAKQYFMLRMNHSLFDCSPTERHLGCL